MAASSNDLIDAQFDRAVEIVQSFPKNGPIQTGYDEKLTMYRRVLLAVSVGSFTDHPTAYTNKLRLEMLHLQDQGCGTCLGGQNGMPGRNIKT
uniref:Uncharacterized protein n=1 Tax=Mycena chlorophos TaxID=658473 RepID=A0ABQ0LS04_MYCCL|nr:predicted protein [Mycena chlorophos]